MNTGSFAVSKARGIFSIALALAIVVAGCDSLITGIYSDDGGAPAGGIDAAPPPCSEGVTICDGAEWQTCTGGTFAATETCDSICDNQFGCVICEPGTASCIAQTSRACKPDGSGYRETYCDSVQGMSCDESSGFCTGPCAPQKLGSNYIGCEYFPTMTANAVSNAFEFAVAVANTASAAITVTIEGGSLTTPIQVSVAPGQVSIQRLPWLGTLKAANCVAANGCTSMSVPAVLARNGAFHLRSTGPITVYQFSALNYQQGGSFSYSNDASLLLPANALDTDYVVAAWPNWPAINLPGIMAITAAQDGTTVNVLSKATTRAGGGAPAFAAGVPQAIMLNQGDVLQLFSYSGDFTGSFVSADKPVQVIGGHFCTNVPLTVAACDHMEESMFPTSALGKTYVVTAPMVPAIPAGKIRIVRVIATAANTSITYDPPQAGAAAALANPGDFLQITNTAASFVISADKKIMVSEYMEGQQAGGGTGDPAFTLAVPSDQYRSEYLFHAPPNYAQNYVNIVALTGETVTLDGAPVTGFSPINATFSLARAGLPAANGGNHTISGSKPFGITVYGYGLYTSYWYPGGLNLELISVD